MVFFFFKQKTAYEMRISDWSSDVCSSDLHRRLALRFRPDRQVEAVGGAGGVVDRADQPAVGQIARGGDIVADGDAEAGGAHLDGGQGVAEVKIGRAHV